VYFVTHSANYCALCRYRVKSTHTGREMGVGAVYDVAIRLTGLESHTPR